MTREKSLFISLCFFLFLHFLSPDSLSTSLDLCVVKSRGEKPEPAFIEPGFNFFLLFLWGLASGVAFLQVGLRYVGSIFSLWFMFFALRSWCSVWWARKCGKKDGDYLAENYIWLCYLLIFSGY